VSEPSLKERLAQFRATPGEGPCLFCDVVVGEGAGRFGLGGDRVLLCAGCLEKAQRFMTICYAAVEADLAETRAAQDAQFNPYAGIFVALDGGTSIPPTLPLASARVRRKKVRTK
jgi:hypothetical protein